MNNKINNLDCIDEQNISEIIKKRLENAEEDAETMVKTLRISRDETKGLEKNMLEKCIINYGYDIMGSVDSFEKGKGNKKGFYEFYVVKKEFAGVC